MSIQKTSFMAVLLVCLTAGSLTAQNQPHYYCLPLRQLDIAGQWPDQEQLASKNLHWQSRQLMKYYMPYAMGSSGEEIYIDFSETTAQNESGRLNLWRIGSVTQLLDNAYIAIKTDRNTPPAGTVYLPKPDLSGMVAVKFTIPKETKRNDAELAKRQFYTAMKNHYDFLRTNGFNGAAWFRYRADQARRILEKDKGLDPNELQLDGQFPRRDSFDENTSLFTGTKAISENIQLDRTLQARLHEPRTIDISTIEGITTAQIDWKALVKEAKVEKDLLARYIPADQHVIFYPTFKSMMYLIDEVKAEKDMLMMNMAIQDIEKYEQQMCVWLDGWSRFWGPKTIRGVAFTGSDPYMQTGTDSAVLFDARMVSKVYSNTESKQKKALKQIKGVKQITGSVEGVDYQAVISPDRAVCSYLAKIDDVVVVTNSLAQLEKIVQTAKSKQPSIADLDEYTFFRSRYPADKKEQTAFLVMTDAAIRRWCGPAWRIGAARRTMAAAILSHLQAEYLDKGQDFDLSKAQKTAASWAPDIGTISLTEAGVTSSVYGSLRYMTPIVELSIEKVSERERNQYDRFRERYQRQWRNFFDPIAVSLLLTPEVMDVDLTVRPLIAASEYREYMIIGGKNTIEVGDGDPHSQTLLQLILAIDADSEPLRQVGGFAQQMMMKQEMNVLSWLGRWITVYADEDPFWDELAGKLQNNRIDPQFYRYMENNIDRLPLALAMDVESPAKLTLFLVSLRAFIQQTAPDITTWETRTYNDRSYVKITARYRSDAENPPSLYYAILPDSLVLSFHEGQIKQAMERGRLRTENKDDEKVYQWQGKNMSARASEKAWTVIEMLAHDNYTRFLQMQSWNNLPILTEWHTRKGKLSEVDFHARYWHTPLTCPGGGDYVWNQEYQTVESSVFGYPGQPKISAQIPTPLTKTKDVQLGITFEEDGLRGKTVIERKD